MTAGGTNKGSFTYSHTTSPPHTTPSVQWSISPAVAAADGTFTYKCTATNPVGSGSKSIKVIVEPAALAKMTLTPQLTNPGRSTRIGVTLNGSDAFGNPIANLLAAAKISTSFSGDSILANKAIQFAAETGPRTITAQVGNIKATGQVIVHGAPRLTGPATARTETDDTVTISYKVDAYPAVTRWSCNRGGSVKGTTATFPVKAKLGTFDYACTAYNALGSGAATTKVTIIGHKIKVVFKVNGKDVSKHTVRWGDEVGSLPEAGVGVGQLAKGQWIRHWVRDESEVKRKKIVKTDKKKYVIDALVEKGMPEAQNAWTMRCPNGSSGKEPVSGGVWVCFEKAIADPELVQVLPKVEAELKAEGILSSKETFGSMVIQGAYHRGFVPSAGTHDRGGTMDLNSRLGTKKAIKIMRKYGIAAWWRWADQFSKEEREKHGVTHHVHFVMVGSSYLTQANKDQVQAYKDGKNGLANGNPDYHARPKTICDFNKILNGSCKAGGWTDGKKDVYWVPTEKK
jgi:hypothetical protein